MLRSGNHAAVARWRRKQSILRTRQRRPDLYAKLDLTSKEDRALLALRACCGALAEKLRAQSLLPQEA